MGAPPRADHQAIRERYLSLMRLLHPDRNPGHAEAAQASARVTASYAELADPDRRLRAERVWRSRMVLCDGCNGEGSVNVTRGFKRKERVGCVACGGSGLQNPKDLAK